MLVLELQIALRNYRMYQHLASSLFVRSIVRKLSELITVERSHQTELVYLNSPSHFFTRHYQSAHEFSNPS